MSLNIGLFVNFISFLYLTELIAVYIDTLVMITLKSLRQIKKEPWKFETNLSWTMISIEKSETNKKRAIEI